MKRWMLVAPLVAGLLALGAGPASANTPQGQGLVSFGIVHCEGEGAVEVFGPRPDAAATGWSVTGLHVVIVQLTVTFTDPAGNVFTFSKDYGAKAGLDTFTCTGSFQDANGTESLVVVVAQ